MSFLRGIMAFLQGLDGLDELHPPPAWFQVAALKHARQRSIAQ